MTTPRLKDRVSTDYLVVHCSATGPNSDFSARDINQWHMKRGFVCIGYHFVIKRDGTLETGRRESEIGAHVQGFNHNSIGVCLVGGVDAQGKAEDNFTPAQWDTLRTLLQQLQARYSKAKILGHRDLTGDGPKTWTKMCPSFDVRKWLAKNPL